MVCVSSFGNPDSDCVVCVGSFFLDFRLNNGDESGGEEELKLISRLVLCGELLEVDEVSESRFFLVKKLNEKKLDYPYKRVS